jgi:hypothetical protein
MNCLPCVLRSGVACAILLTVVFAHVSCEHSGRSRDRFATEAEEARTARLGRIEDESAGPDDLSWAGTYYRGDGTGTNATLTLGRNGGFAFEHRGCLGVYARGFGTVLSTERGSLKLHYTDDDERKDYWRVPDELVPIAWGNRRYLIPSDEVVEFCNSINAQHEPRPRMHGMYFLREGDHEKPVHGPPELPAQFQPYLLDKPIHAEVIAVKPTVVEGPPVELSSDLSFHKAVVTLNVGRRANVLPGMAFHVYEPAKIGALVRARVISVDENTCNVLTTQMNSDSMPAVPPAVGWKLTTGPRLSRSTEAREPDKQSAVP